MQQNFPRVLHKHDDRLEIVFIVKGRGIHLIGDVKYHTKPGRYSYLIAILFMMKCQN